MCRRGLPLLRGAIRPVGKLKRGHHMFGVLPWIVHVNLNLRRVR